MSYNLASISSHNLSLDMSCQSGHMFLAMIYVAYIMLHNLGLNWD